MNYEIGVESTRPDPRPSCAPTPAGRDFIHRRTEMKQFAREFGKEFFAAVAGFIGMGLTVVALVLLAEWVAS